MVSSEREAKGHNLHALLHSKTRGVFRTDTVSVEICTVERSMGQDEEVKRPPASPLDSIAAELERMKIQKEAFVNQQRL